jgi:hypothetical protein
MLVGAGISERGGLGDLERTRLNDRIARLQADLDAASARKEEQVAADQLAERGWKALVAYRLTGKRVAVLFVGSVDEGVRTSVDDTVTQAGGTIARLSAVTVPIATQDVEGALRARPALQGYVGVDRLQDLGRDLGRELVDGGETPLWDALSGSLVEETSGTSADPVDGIVVCRTAIPQAGETGRFVNGLYAGLVGAARPAVGVERSAADISAVKAYRRAGLSSVDDVDLPAGRVALAILLAGGPEGHYGIKETSRRMLPPIEPVPPTAVP